MSSKQRLRDRWALVSVVMAMHLVQGDARAQSEALRDGPAPDAKLACAADRYLIYPNESVFLTAWHFPPQRHGGHYGWTVDQGRVTHDADGATWDLSGARVGTHRATVHGATVDGKRAECTLTVVLSLPALSLMGEDRETGRSLLPPGRNEDKGYGLYSYLILGAEPDASSMPRYLATVIEYLRFPEARLLEMNGFKKSELNITYLPLSDEPDAQMLADLRERRYARYPEIADWLVRHYDYARARALLKAAGADARSGPYFVSALTPLGSHASASPRLVQDLSTVPPKVVGLWTRQFLAQAARERFWKKDRLTSFALDLRTFLAVAAEGAPKVSDSLSSIVKMLE